MRPDVEYNSPSVETNTSRVSRISSIFLMVAILVVAGTVSAITAMRFAIHGREVVVPELAGKSEQEAREILSGIGLQLKVSSQRFSTDVPEGRIVSQTPNSGTSLKINRSVRVLVSRGDRKFAVPNLLGASLRAAQLTLGQRKFTLGNTLYAHM